MGAGVHDKGKELTLAAYGAADKAGGVETAIFAVLNHHSHSSTESVFLASLANKGPLVACAGARVTRASGVGAKLRVEDRREEGLENDCEPDILL